MSEKSTTRALQQVDLQSKYRPLGVRAVLAAVLVKSAKVPDQAAASDADRTAQDIHVVDDQ